MRTSSVKANLHTSLREMEGTQTCTDCRDVLLPPLSMRAQEMWIFGTPTTS